MSVGFFVGSMLVNFYGKSSSIVGGGGGGSGGAG